MSGTQAGSSHEVINDQETQEAVARLREQVGRVPAGELVAEAAGSLLTLAYMRLGLPQGNEPYRDLDAARVLIDAVGGMLEATGGRLGQVEPSLRDALARARLTYVEVAGAAGPPAAHQPAKEPPAPGGAASRLWVPGRD